LGRLADCYQHATYARERAEQAHDEITKQDFLDMQRRWLSLAHSYELAERISDFTENIPRRHDRKKAPTEVGAKLPMRA
jgi:hypothetical protein